MDSSSDLRQQRVSGLDSELLAGRFGPQFSRLVLHPQFSLQSIVFLPVALTAHVLFPMSGEDACEFRRLVADTFPKWKIITSTATCRVYGPIPRRPFGRFWPKADTPVDDCRGSFRG